MFSGGTGSSNQSRSYGSRSQASLSTSLTANFQWQSIATRTSGPTASRTASTMETIQRRSAVTIGVDPDAVAEAPTKEVVDGGVERAPDEIPERDLDAADGGDSGAGQRALAGEATNHQVVELADVVRVLADDDRRGFVHELGDSDPPIC